MIRQFLNKIIYSLPIRLLISQIKRSHILLLSWFLLFAVITGQLGKYLGVPSLFLDPEYLNKVNFLSFFIMGVAIAFFTTAFHITCYIVDGYQYNFIGSLTKPFAKFSINNSLIPIVFLLLYLVNIVKYQIQDEEATSTEVALALSGVIIGFVIMLFVFYAYFWFTNKDIFKVIAYRFDRSLKRNVRVTRANVMSRLVLAKQKREKVKYYINFQLKLAPVKERGFDKKEVLKVFDQNHLNLVFIELFIFLILLLLGVFREFEVFQIPAAASAILFLTIIIMFTGAFSYWFRSWSAAIIIGLLLLVNFGVQRNVLKSQYQAFGLNYNNGRVAYDLDKIKALDSDSIIMRDRAETMKILENWRAKFGKQKPKMLFLAASGGGQRSALWTFRALQYADSITAGKLMNNAMLVTGASGGLIGAAFFRELVLQQKNNQAINPYNEAYLTSISNDNLNPIIFSFLVNDMFVKFQKFTYNNREYVKDRGYSFEEQLDKNTFHMLDKPLSAYREPETKAEVPMLIATPTIINDGRKLFISPHNVGYMNSGDIRALKTFDKLAEGVDFLRLYKDYDAKNLRFLSALRMCATFPYVTPNITLPSEPKMEIMDAGITDNFGISDALQFLYAFRNWIAENTSGIVILSIRDSKKEIAIEPRKNLSLFDKMSTPVSNVYENYAKMQTITNDSKIEYATSWFNNQIDVINLQYIPTYDPKYQKPSDVRRAALNWRLTGREKKSVIFSINSKSNQQALKKLTNLLQ
jgi:patatin-like phospholipase